MPTFETGILFEKVGSWVFAKADGLGFHLKWNAKEYLVVIEVAASLWGATEGLCGNHDGNPFNDFVPRGENFGGDRVTLKELIASWSHNGQNCGEIVQHEDICSHDESEENRAERRCQSILTKPGLQFCRTVISQPDIQGDYYRVSLSKLNLHQDFKVKPILMHTSLNGILLDI